MVLLVDELDNDYGLKKKGRTKKNIGTNSSPPKKVYIYIFFITCHLFIYGPLQKARIVFQASFLRVMLLVCGGVVCSCTVDFVVCIIVSKILLKDAIRTWLRRDDSWKDQNQNLETLTHYYISGMCVALHFILYTLPETIAPENQWLEDEFPFGMAYFQALC